jgi:hypothetical protein
MISRQRVWGLLSFRAFIINPLGDLEVDLSKLFLLESPYTRIACHRLPWTIRFNFSIYCCSNGIMAPSLLSFRASLVAVALTFYWMVDKFCVLCFCYCCCVVISLVVVFPFSVVVRLVVFSLYYFATLLIGSRSMTYVIFAALIVGFGALLCNLFGCQ